MWEPAHYIELATKDIKEITTVFDWFVEHISICNGIFQTVNIGKGLDQCLTAAEEQNRTLDFLPISGIVQPWNTLFNGCSANQSIESRGKDQREHASNWLKKILTKTFIMVNLGLTDIYRLLGFYSCFLQPVEQFLLSVEGRLRELIQSLKHICRRQAR